MEKHHDRWLKQVSEMEVPNGLVIYYEWISDEEAEGIQQAMEQVEEVQMELEGLTDEEIN